MNHLETQLQTAEQTAARVSQHVDKADLNLGEKRRALAKAKNLHEEAQIRNVLTDDGVNPLLAKAVDSATKDVEEAESKLHIAIQAARRAVEKVERIRGEIQANSIAVMQVDIAKPVVELNRLIGAAAAVAQQIHNRMAAAGCSNLGVHVFPSPDPNDSTAAFTARNQRCSLFNALANLQAIGGVN